MVRIIYITSQKHFKPPNRMISSLKNYGKSGEFEQNNNKYSNYINCFEDWTLNFNNLLYWDTDIDLNNKTLKEVLHKLSVAISKLQKENIIPKENSNDIYYPNWWFGRKHIDFARPIVISVSGGVDSMVCLLISHAFGLKTVAVSIDYANRPEQADEINMVNYVCNTLGIQHYVRRITEMQRPRDSNREFYETFTRDIRFNTYKKIVNLTGAQGVVLGHNQDDTLENVFSNIKKRKGYSNLFGMSHRSEEREVTIIRPLLDVSKKDILALAHKYKIPYTYDSTPAWSERGKMRDKLIPFLQNFDAALLPGIIELVSNYTQIYEVYTKSIPTIKFNLDSCEVVCSDTIYLFDYWKRIFTNVALHYKVPFAKNKSVAHFILQIQQGNMYRLTISKHMVAQKTDSKLVIHMYL